MRGRRPAHRRPRQARAPARPPGPGAHGAGGEQRQAMRDFVEQVRHQELLPGRASTASPTCSSPRRATRCPADPGQRRLAHVFVGRHELPRPRHGCLRDALHPLQGPDLVPGRPDHQGRPRRPLPTGSTRATSSTTSRATTATSPAATSSGTATASPTSTSTAASPWPRSPPSSRPSSRCSRTTTCSPSTSKGAPSGTSSPRSPTTTPSTSRSITIDLVVARAPGGAPDKVAWNVKRCTRGRRRQDQGRPGVHRLVRQRPPQRLRRRRRDLEGPAGRPRRRG